MWGGTTCSPSRRLYLFQVAGSGKKSKNTFPSFSPGTDLGGDIGDSTTLIRGCAFQAALTSISSISDNDERLSLLSRKMNEKG